MAYSSLPSTRRLSRNKVSVGEPADGSPLRKPEAGTLCRVPVSTLLFNDNFTFYTVRYD